MLCLAFCILESVIIIIEAFFTEDICSVPVSTQSTDPSQTDITCVTRLSARGCKGYKHIPQTNSLRNVTAHYEIMMSEQEHSHGQKIIKTYVFHTYETRDMLYLLQGVFQSKQWQKMQFNDVVK